MTLHLVKMILTNAISFDDGIKQKPKIKKDIVVFYFNFIQNLKVMPFPL